MKMLRKRQMDPVKIVLKAVLVLVLYSSFAQADSCPDLGIIWNDDGDCAITSDDSAQAAEVVRYSINSCAGTGVKTITYSIAAGSEILLYPTRVGNNWGWRKTSYDQNPKWKTRIERGRALAAKDYDAVRIAAVEAKKHDFYFFPSCRMNDSHFIFDPLEYPLTGKFWIENSDCRIGASGKSPSDRRKEYANLLDYSNEKVRRYRLDIITEVIDRYKDVMDGIELDFSRTFFLFPPEKAEENAHLITDMLVKVKEKLNGIGKSRGFWIIVRIPSNMKSCKKLGYEIEKWMQQKLVDVVVPTQLMTTPFEMPLDEFTKLSKQYGCKVYAGLYDRVGWEFPFSASPDSYEMAPDRVVRPEMMRAAYANYWSMGADGMYLFNMKLSPKDDLEYYRIVRDAAAPECIRFFDKVYAVTKAYYLDYENTYTYSKQLPCKVKTDQEKVFTIYVGEEGLGEKDLVFPQYIGLRLGFVDLNKEDLLEVKLNDHLLYSGAAGDYLTKTKPPKNIDRLNPKAAGVFWQYEIENAGMITRGSNSVSVKVTSGIMPEINITDINIGICYENDLLKLLIN